jgi:ribosomal protein S18 acetylase RimI-like enzyme
MNKELMRDASQVYFLRYKNLTHSIPANIRFVSKRDFEQITAIEHSSFDFHSTLCGDKCYVVEHDGFIAAYVIIKYHQDHIELCNLAVERYHRRRKIASLIIDMLKIKLNLEKKDYISVHISERNLPAQLFLRSNGFVAKNVVRNYYAPDHSAYYMELESA